MVDSVVVVLWASSASGSGRVVSTLSHAVAVNVWVSQSRRNSSGKSQTSFSFSPSLMKHSKAISRFSPTIVGE